MRVQAAAPIPTGCVVVTGGVRTEPRLLLSHVCVVRQEPRQRLLSTRQSKAAA